jgi:hypothetical protein
MVEISIGNQQSWSAKRNWPMNSFPYGYGALRAEPIVRPVRRTISPISVKKLLAGSEALFTAALTISPRR